MEEENPFPIHYFPFTKSLILELDRVLILGFTTLKRDTAEALNAEL